MAARTVAQTDTLETFRTEFNGLSSNDFGDVGTLDAGISATSIVGAVNEIYTTVTGLSGVTITDSTSTTREVGLGQTLVFLSDSNTTITTGAADSDGNDSVTVGLASSISGLTSVSATTITDGTASLSSGSLTSAVNVTGSGTANFTTDVQVNSVSVATKPFAIAQAIALG